MSRYTTVRGYDIRIKAETGLTADILHAWAPAGTLPSEWEAVKARADVAEAEIYYSTQRTRRADRRQVLDSFSREQGQGGQAHV